MSAEERDETPTPPDENPSEAATGTQTIEAPPDAIAQEGEGKLNQTVEITDAGPCKKHVKITVARSDIDELFAEKYSEIAKAETAPLRGFRPGKAPRKIIERRFAKEVAVDVKRQVLMASLQQLAEEVELSPLSAPDINPDAIEIPESGPMVYEFNIEVRPEFDLPAYRGMKVRRPIHTFSDAEVLREKKRILEDDGQLVPKETGAAELDDVVVADIHVKYKGQTINELKEVRFRVDKRLALSDGVAEKFDKAMIGAKIGDQRPVDIKLSDELANSILKGQTVNAVFEIKDIKSYRLPEMTEDLLKDFGVKNEVQLDELIRAALERRLEYSQRQAARKQLLDVINDSTKLDLPNDMLRKQATKTLQRRIMEMRNNGIPEEQIRGRMQIMQQDVVRTTALLLKEHFVLQKIAEVEKIEIGDEDIDAEIERLADQNDENPRRLRARLEKEDLIESIAADLLERKALDLVLEHAEYDDYPLDAEESEPALASTEASAVHESRLEKPAEEPTEGESPSNPPEEEKS